MTASICLSTGMMLLQIAYFQLLRESKSFYTYIVQLLKTAYHDDLRWNQIFNNEIPLLLSELINNVRIALIVIIQDHCRIHTNIGFTGSL